MDPVSAPEIAAPTARAAQLPSRRERMWPAVLVLFLLSPIIAEMLSGSTPPLAWLNPLNLIVQPALYGSGDSDDRAHVGAHSCQCAPHSGRSSVHPERRLAAYGRR